jgi:hypothetical protein
MRTNESIGRGGIGRAEAIAAIDAAADRAGKHLGADEVTLVALRFLWRHSDDAAFRETLVWFRESLDSENYIGRSQNANASRNRIKVLLGIKA